MMCRIILVAISLLLFISLSFGQVADTTEADTLTVTKARAMVRFNLNDYGSNKTWSDSAVDNWLHQSCWEIASQGVIVRRDTIKTAANTSWYLLNADFMRAKEVLIKYTEDNRWRSLALQGDSVSVIEPAVVKYDTIITADTVVWYMLNTDFMRAKNVFVKYTIDNTWRALMLQSDSIAITKPEVVRHDTIITTANTVWYSLNTDIMRVRDVLVKDKGDRWKGLKPRGANVWARDSDIGINTYEIDGTFLRIDRPSSQAGDSIVVVYNPYYEGIRGYEIDGNFLHLNKVAADSGDSIIVVYNPYYEGVKGYDIDGKYLRIDKTPADTGDSLIVVYFAYANDLTDSGGVIVNLPYEYQMQLIQGAVARAKTSNRE